MVELRWLVRDISDKVAVYKELEAHRDQLRALSMRIMESKEEEARRIAHALHDEAGQMLASVHLH